MMDTHNPNATDLRYEELQAIADGDLEPNADGSLPPIHERWRVAVERARDGDVVLSGDRLLEDN